jgi:hypothetical protein
VLRQVVQTDLRFVATRFALTRERGCHDGGGQEQNSNDFPHVAEGPFEPDLTLSPGEAMFGT